MTRFHLHLQRVGFVLTGWAALVLANDVRGQSTWNTDTNNNGPWHDAGSWTGGIPNAVDASVIFNMPLTTQSPAPGTYTISLGDTATTVGHITANHAGDGTTHAIVSGTLVFQSTSGPATVIENAGIDDTLRNRLRYNLPVTLLSDLEYTQNNDPQLNTSSEFVSQITAASNITLTKKGDGNLQFAFAGAVGATEGFLGNLVIESGAVRLIVANQGPDIENTTFRNAAGVTVMAGGQYQLGNTISYSRLGPGAELKLNGAGKASGAMNAGALRFENADNLQVSCTFDSPINLQSMASIHVAADDCTGILPQEIRGPGELRKTGLGLLRVTAANVYTGGTGVYNGVMDVSNTSGSGVGTGDVIVNLAELGGTGIIGSASDASNVALTDAVLSPGTLAATFPGGLVTGPGVLTVFGDVSFDSISSLNIDLSGVTVGTQYDQLIASGLSLGGAALNLSLGAFVPTGSETFTIVNNTGGAAVSGEFAGLAQGAQVDLAGVPFFIDYAGGDGNDVVLASTVPGDEDADFDGDGDVDGADFLTWQQNLGGTGGLAQGDANNDSAINGDDLAIWKNQFGPGGASVGAVAAVPEPAALMVLASAVAALAVSWRRQQPVCS
jgi:autotransporter-associated beta strand protein